MKNLWHQDKLKTATVVLWLLTVITSFFGDAVVSIALPAVGALFPFRVFLPAATGLYAIWLIRNRANLWKVSGKIEKLCWLVVAFLLAHSVVSLPFAIDFSFSFRRLFNLCFDLLFFCMAIRLCSERKVLRYTLICAGATTLVLQFAGIYEAFCGGIFNDTYDNFKRFKFFEMILQYPIVTYANTNDFASTIVFALAAILVFWGQGYLGGKRRIWVLLILVPLAFFMAIASSARLVILCMWMLLAGLILFFLIGDKRRIYLPIIVLVLFLGVLFTNNYTSPIGEFSEMPLQDELFELDEENNKLILNQNTSGGVRLRLLQHAGECFADSWGMGVGIGNTEQLAKIKFSDAEKPIWSIHCFLARLAGDYGIWALIPLCLIGYYMAVGGLRKIKRGIQKKDRNGCAFGVLYLTVLALFPILSTASSDAQDLLAMWLYLAVMVVLGASQGENYIKEANTDA